MSVNGVDYNVTTDAGGVARLNIHLGVGDYTIGLYNPVSGVDNHSSVFIKKTLIDNNDLSMFYDDGSSYSVRVVGDDGNVVGAGVSVKFTLNGKTYTVKTDSQGCASLKVTLPPKTYQVSAEYKGYKVSNNVVVKSHFIGKEKVTVKRSTINKRGSLIIRYNMGKYFAGKKVTLNFPGKNYVVKVANNGLLRLNINKNVVNKLKVGKKYSYKLTYKLDSKVRHIMVYKNKLVFVS